MSFVDPLKQPQRFIQQADALFRASFTQPAGKDPFDVVNAHLEASFESVLASVAQPAPSPAAEPKAGASGPVSIPGYGMGLPVGQLPWVGGGAGMGAWPMGGVSAIGAPGASLRSGMPLGAALEGMIGKVSTQHGVPEWLVRSVVRAESGGNPLARSPVGAMGLMQLMPGTAAELGVQDAYDPVQNLDGGTRYLRQMLDRFGGDVTKAVAAYNAGPGAVEQHGGVPPYAETQAYVKRVLE